MVDCWLRGKRVTVTGRLVAMTHADFSDLVAARGGEFVPLANRGTSVLVIGQEGWPLEPDGRQTVSLVRARRYRAYGYPIELLSEEEFYGRLELAEPQSAIHRRSTINQLSRLLKLPGRQLRSWLRAGLIEPAEVVFRLAYFDFQQVASAKNICELTLAGVKAQQIRESLEQLRNWLPGVDTPLAQLSLLEHNGQLLVRLPDNTLAEPSGQLHFDFAGEAAGDRDVFAFSAKTADAWFEEGLDAEDAGRSEEAVFAYQEAIKLEPNDPVLHFNLGNAFYTGGMPTDAAEHFRHAVTIDPNYAEAWNNLGSVLDDLGQVTQAIPAFKRALRLVPGYADAHANLMAVLSKTGQFQGTA